MIPIYLQENLIRLAKQLPRVYRKGFIHSVTQRLEDIAVTYPRTLVYSCAGYCIGHLIDSITGLPVTLPCMIAGGLFGLNRDIGEDEMHDAVQRAVKEEFNKFREFTP